MTHFANTAINGGSWVVVYPTINEDPDSRGGILEPVGITELRFRAPDQLKVIESQLKMLDAELDMCKLEENKKVIRELRLSLLN